MIGEDGLVNQGSILKALSLVMPTFRFHDETSLCLMYDNR